MGYRIAVLFHERNRQWRLPYLIDKYAGFWQADGHSVFPLYGVSEFVPADLIFVHVDLSVVPQEYLDFAARYPISLNGKVRDIRKTAFSKNLVRPGDGYEGKVIVKSNINCAGEPERYLGFGKELSPEFASIFRYQTDYPVYDHPQLVPSTYYSNPDVVLEKFLPEQEGDLFFTRSALFLGDRVTCTRLASKVPVVKGSTQVRAERVEPHAEIMKLRKKMNYDYGKFDYVIHKGKAVLLDANKTPGESGLPDTPERVEMHRYRANGLYSYFGR